MWIVFIGWFLFVVFGGIGLVALPYDLILDYYYRPKPRSALELAEKKVALRRRVEELMSYTRQIDNLSEAASENEGGWWSSWKANRKLRTKENRLEKELLILEEEYEIYEEEIRLTSNPVLQLMKLILGILLAVVSLLLIVQMIVNNLIIINNRPADYFLSRMLWWLEYKIARFVSTIVLSAIGFYLVFCIMKGNVKFGFRFLFLIKIHPMKLGRTYMNSFLFNAALVMCAVVACAHFMTMIFSNYMRLTSGYTIYGVLLTNLRFLRYFWAYKIFLYAILVMVVVTFLYMLIKPKNDRLDIKAMIARRKKV